MNSIVMESSPTWFTAAVADSSRKSLSLKHSVGDSGMQRLSLAALKTKKTHKRPVKFDEESRVVHQLEAGEENVGQLWFSKQEIRVLRNEGRETLWKVENAGGDLAALDASEESIRGLEHGLSVYDHGDEVDAAPLGRSERRNNIVHTILAQQQEQKELGIDDPKGLQVTSKACTQWARDRAIDIAVKDFQDACDVWQDDKDCANLLPPIIHKMSRRMSGGGGGRRSSILSACSVDSRSTTPEDRRATLDNISRTVATALEELDDLEF